MAFPWQLVFASTLEPYLSGWTVYLDNNRNGRRDPGEPSTTTDAQGSYSFPNVAAGAYVVGVETQPRWVVTAPSTAVHIVTVASGAVVTGIDFGAQQLREEEGPESGRMGGKGSLESGSGGVLVHSVLS